MFYLAWIILQSQASFEDPYFPALVQDLCGVGRSLSSKEIRRAFEEATELDWIAKEAVGVLPKDASVEELARMLLEAQQETRRRKGLPIAQHSEFTFDSLVRQFALYLEMDLSHAGANVLWQDFDEQLAPMGAEKRKAVTTMLGILEGDGLLGRGEVQVGDSFSGFFEDVARARARKLGVEMDDAQLDEFLVRLRDSKEGLKVSDFVRELTELPERPHYLTLHYQEQMAPLESATEHLVDLEDGRQVEIEVVDFTDGDVGMWSWDPDDFESMRFRWESTKFILPGTLDVSGIATKEELGLALFRARRETLKTLMGEESIPKHAFGSRMEELAKKVYVLLGQRAAEELGQESFLRWGLDPLILPMNPRLLLPMVQGLVFELEGLGHLRPGSVKLNSQMSLMAGLEAVFEGLTGRPVPMSLGSVEHALAEIYPSVVNGIFDPLEVIKAFSDGQSKPLREARNEIIRRGTSLPSSAYAKPTPKDTKKALEEPKANTFFHPDTELLGN